MFRFSLDSAQKIPTAIARCSLMTLAFLALAAGAPAQTGNPHFFVLNNPGDPNFNQLLGINNAHEIAGYFGDGTIVPNNGYLLVPRNHYSVENFTNLPSGDFASETQAIGINSQAFPVIVGFYTDNATGVTHGFVDANGTQSTVDDPVGSAPYVTAPVQNLLGINDLDWATGFWTDNGGHEHGFVVQLNLQTLSKSKFIEIPPSIFKGAVATQASDIISNGWVCGFWTDRNGNDHGFFGPPGPSLSTFPALYALNVEVNGVPAVSTMPFGCNDKGEVVGSFTDASGNVHGFTFYQGLVNQFDAPGSSQTPAFGVMGTFINGVNNAGDIVGFFSDGTNVNGFLDVAP